MASKLLLLGFLILHIVCCYCSNINPTEHLKPDMIEGSILFSNSRVSNTSTPNQAEQRQNGQWCTTWFGSGSGSQQANLPDFNQEADQILSETDCMELQRLLTEGEHSQLANQHQFNQAYQNPEFGMGRVSLPQRHQLDQVGPSVADQSYSLIQASQSNFLPSIMSVESVSQQPLSQAGLSQTDSDRMMRFEETRQTQWSQGEPSQNAQQTKSGSGEALPEVKRKTPSAIYSKNYRMKQKEKMDAAEFLFDKIREGEDIRADHFKHLIPPKAKRLKVQSQIHHPSSSALALANFPGDHLGTDSREVGQDRHETDFGDVGQDHHGTDSREVASGSHMINDVQDPNLGASTSSACVVTSAHCTENQDSSQTGATPMAELPKKSKSKDITSDSNRELQGASDEIVKMPQHRDDGAGSSTTLPTLSYTSPGVQDAFLNLVRAIEQIESEKLECHDRVSTLDTDLQEARTANEKLQAEVNRLNEKLAKIISCCND